MQTTSRFFLVILLLSGLLISSLAYAVTVTRGPYLQMGTKNAITARWRTDTNTNSVVRYGSSPNNLNQTVTVSGSVTEHEVRLTGLSPLTQYYYSVGNSSESLAGGDSSYRFTTSPTPGNSAPTRVWVIGDSGTANSSAAAVYNAYLNYSGADSTNLWIMLGDNAYNDGTDSQYQSAVFNMYPELLRRTPLWSTLGNHDGHTADSGSESGPYFDIFSFPRNAEVGGLASGTEAYYSFDYGDIHFICLDSYDTDRSPKGAMMTWLENDLAATDQKWIIAFWHHPPYTKGSHDSDTESALIDMRKNALPILESYGVDLVLAGHTHAYERSFLIDGHYGSADTFNSSHLIDNGDGREDGNGAYQKTDNSVHLGAVYTVAGASGKVSSGSLNHPAMFASLSQLGSVVLDINNNRLDAKYLRSDGTVTDYYTLIKGQDAAPPTISAATANANNEVLVTFSETVDKTTAENTANYSIDNGISVSAASASGKTVTLTTSTLTQGTSYTLSVNNVQDTNSNAIAANSQISFSYQNIQTISFQNGVLPTSGFDGTEDTYIASGNPGSNFGSSSAILADGSDGGNGELVSLVKWDVSNIPAGSAITSVQIEFEVFNKSSGAYNLYAGAVPWSEKTATWNNIDPYTNKGSLVASFQPSSVGTYNIDLNSEGKAIVQSWVNGSANNGFFVMTGGTSDGTDIRSSEYSSANQHPKLIVTYEVGSGNTPPASNYSYTINALNVDFTDTSLDTDGTIVSWAWNFGDGNTSSSQNPSHVYANEGTRAVTLMVTDNDGLSDSINQSVTVSVANDTETPSVPTGLAASDVTTTTVSLIWLDSTDNIGVAGYKVRRDGVQMGDISSVGFTDTSLSSNTTVDYTVEAYDMAGNHSDQSAIERVTTGNIFPDANFTYETNQLNISFTDSSTDNDGNLVAWHWDFGEGNESSLQNPTHSYATAGTYDVNLTVTDTNGATGSISQIITVSDRSEPITIELQQGLSGYVGAQDTYVAKGIAESNFGSNTSILADGDDRRRDELISLLQWDVSSIPSGVTITAVSITLQVHNRTHKVYNLWEMKTPWFEDDATWSNTQPKTNIGAKIGNFIPSSTGAYTIPLNAEGIGLVQSWVDGSVNYGFTIESGGTRNGVDMRSSEYGTLSQRPKLTITYK